MGYEMREEQVMDFAVGFLGTVGDQTDREASR